MGYRLVGRAEARITAILVESGRRHGLDAAVRYGRLIFATLHALGNAPDCPGSRHIPAVAGLRILHLKTSRRLVTLDERVSQPRHMVIYRTAPDGAVEILSVIHDRMLVSRAARRAQRDASVQRID